MLLESGGTDPLRVIAAVIIVVATFYLYQVASRKRERLRYKFKFVLVGEIACFCSYALSQQRLPSWQAMIFSLLVGIGTAHLLVKQPRASRRIQKRVREQVIARDLTSKGLKWDGMKYQIDHIVPFSRGGDNSLRNLRVIEKDRNLRKGAQMPGLRDFLRR